MALVVRRAVRLGTDSGTITVTDVGEGGVPSGVGVVDMPDLRQHGVQRGDAAHLVSGRGVLIGPDSVFIDLTGAESWSSQLPLPPRLVVRPIALDAAHAAAARHASAHGLGPLVCPSVGMTPVATRAAETIASALGALATGEPAQAAHAIIPLIGLGEGLTPSGDDFIVGLVAVLTAGDHPAVTTFARTCAAAAVGLTTIVGIDLLQHAAAGRFVERVHDLISALYHDDAAATRTACTSLLRMGSTSGMDTLVGVLAGMDLLLASGEGKFTR